MKMMTDKTYPSGCSCLLLMLVAVWLLIYYFIIGTGN